MAKERKMQGILSRMVEIPNYAELILETIKPIKLLDYQLPYIKEGKMVTPIEVTAYSQAERFIGIKEIAGEVSNPQILAMLKLDSNWPLGDEVPWCSAFANYICWWLRLPRSKSLRARSWLEIGHSIMWSEAEVGFDVVILKRGGGNQPGPDVIKASGHVGFFGGWEYNYHSPHISSFSIDEETWKPKAIKLLGGNQADGVNVSSYDTDRILGIHRLRS